MAKSSGGTGRDTIREGSRAGESVSRTRVERRALVADRATDRIQRPRRSIRG